MQANMMFPEVLRQGVKLQRTVFDKDYKKSAVYAVGVGFTRSQLMEMGFEKAFLRKAERDPLVKKTSVSPNGGVEVFYFTPIEPPELITKGAKDE